MNLSIEAYPSGINESNAPTVEVRFSHHADFDGSALWLHGGLHSSAARFSVGTPAQARELAQQLQGAADALVAFAVRRGA